MKTTLHTRIFRALLMAVLIVATALPASAYDYMYDSIYYNRVGNTYKVNVTYKDQTYNSYHGTVNIPDTWSDSPYYYYKVVGIGERAFKDCYNLTQVIIGPRVNAINKNAFQNCTSLPSITIPSTVDIINDNAFEGCTSLSNISIPLNTKLGKNLFKGCSGITSLSFLNGRRFIEIGMFQDCSGLTKLQLPQSIDSICANAFMGCQGFSKLTITKDIKYIGQYAFKDCNSIDTLVFNESISNIVINNDAFSGCNALTTIVCKAITPPAIEIGLGLSSSQISDIKLIVPRSSLEAYQNADGWKDFTNIEAISDFYDFEFGGIYFNVIGENEVEISCKDTSYNTYQCTFYEDEIDLYDSPYAGIQHWGSVGIPENVIYGGKNYQVTSIGENAFRNCTSLNFINLSGMMIKHIAENAFKGCSNMKRVTFPRYLETIGNHAFEGCSSLHVASFKEGVTSIGSCAFKGCSRLLAIELPSTIEHIGEMAFEGCPLNGHDWTANVGIYCYAFNPPIIENSNAFSQSSYSNSVVKVLHSRVNTYWQDEMWGNFAKIRANVFDFSKDGVYYRINSENEVSIAPSNELTYGGNKRDAYLPEQVEYNGRTYTVTAIDDKAFYFTDDIDITIPNTVKRIGSLAFANNLSVIKIEMGDSVESIGFGAFYQSHIKEITIPQSVKYIGDSAFFSTPSLNKIIVEEGNPVYDSRGNCNALIKTANNTLVASSNNTIIPLTVTKIAAGAFYGRSIWNITIPKSVKTIGKYAFMGIKTNNLEFELPSSIEYIDTLCFAATNLKRIDIPSSVKIIGEGAFCANQELTTIIIPNSVDIIKTEAFLSCTALEELTIPDNVNIIEPMAFYDCRNLKVIRLGCGIKTIGDLAFNCPGIPVDYGYPSHAIDSIYCTATIPPSLLNENCFESSYSSATLYVPKPSVEKYKTTYGWKNFFQILPIEETGIIEVAVDPAVEGKRQRYNIMGQPVGDDYKGIVIENGKKEVVK